MAFFGAAVVVGFFGGFPLVEAAVGRDGKWEGGVEAAGAGLVGEELPEDSDYCWGVHVIF